MNRLTTLAALLGLSMAASATSQEEKALLKPRLKEATVTLGQETIKPAQDFEKWTYTRRVGDLEVGVRDGVITAFDAAGKKKWELPKVDQLAWLASDAKTVYMAARDAGEEALEVRRIDASTGQWVDPLRIPTGEKKDKTAEQACAAIADKDGLTVLTARVVRDRSSHDNGTMLAYRVTRFASGKAEPAWSQEYQSAGPREHPGAFLLSSPSQPDYANDSATPLLLMGSQVVVCAGPKEDILCIERASGKEAWRLARVWEFRRGFIGPSVWSHYLGRYGWREHDLELAEKGPLQERVAKEKARIEEQSGAVVAGPVLVNEGSNDPSLFVVVARSERSAWSGYLADAVVYELNDRGAPVGIATLPRMVNAGHCAIGSGGVTWGCTRGGFVRIAPNGQRSSQAGMLGGGDMLCRIDWYRQINAPTIKAWLTAGPAGDPIAFTESHAFRPLAGGYISKQGDHVYHFPMARVDLKNGSVESFVLNVPFDGDAPKPATNYSETADGIQAMGPHQIGVTWLQVAGGSLEVVIATPESAGAVRFSLSELGASKYENP